MPICFSFIFTGTINVKTKKISVTYWHICFLIKMWDLTTFIAYNPTGLFSCKKFWDGLWLHANRHIWKATTLTTFREKRCDIWNRTPRSFKPDGPVVDSAAKTNHLLCRIWTHNWKTEGTCPIKYSNLALTLSWCISIVHKQQSKKVESGPLGGFFFIKTLIVSSLRYSSVWGVAGKLTLVNSCIVDQPVYRWQINLIVHMQNKTIRLMTNSALSHTRKKSVVKGRHLDTFSTPA